MAQFLRVYINSFIFLFTILFSIRAINSHDDHYHNNKNGILDRNKRDVFPPNILRIQIIHGNHTETFELSKMEPDYLVNWNAFVYAYNKNAANNFSNLGQISSFKNLTTFYYDKPTHSAVVFYNQSIFGGNCLVNGIIGEKYVLKYKPYAEYKGVANISVDSTDVIPKKIKRRTRSISEALKTNIGNSYENPEFYLETLVFIDGILVNEQFPGEMKRESNRQKLYVMQVLSFLNVINMLFSETNFRINIAGIIFNQRYEDGRFFFLNSALSDDIHQYKIPQVVDAFYEALPNLPRDLSNRDLFDYILHLTDFSLYDTETNKVTEGLLSYPTFGIYQTRKSESFRSYPLIISNSSLNYPSVANVAHHLFHLIGSANYIKKYNSTKSSQSTIIRDFDSKCADYYDWTEDYCVFINKPRVSSSSPSILVSKNDQCWCYDYSYKYHNDMKITGSDICAKGFQCELGKRVILNVTLVLDGTPCDINKVCWNKACTQIG
ncbi:uncharacterized protein [Chelonus insularis]|uniref:uncharacterized protein n=1 Tax=Chelonus insularis TaxID=460826 RepID=UPI00158C5145|nr:uncharacterized protein LOC118063736 [Chelonus insularis]KAG8148385.1 BVpp48b-41b-like protein [Chelonus insularis]